MHTHQPAFRSPTPVPRYYQGVNKLGRAQAPLFTVLAALAASVAVALCTPSNSNAARRTRANSAAPSASAAPKTNDSPAATPPHPDRGIVVIERAARAVALGVVLSGDGRILTALSTLGDGNAVDARFADGSLVHVRVGHSDRTWDLALLVPQIGRWPEGLTAASEDPLRAGSHIKSFSQQRGRIIAASIVLKGRSELLGGDGGLLRDAIEITSRVPATDFGTPLVNESGQVLGIVSRACLPAKDPSAPCNPIAYAAPIDVLRQFLRNAPANAIPPSPWLGIQGIAEVTALARGVRIVLVHPDSPADEAGFRPDIDPTRADIIIAVDGVPVPSPERLAEVVRTKAVGDRIEIITMREGRVRVVPVILRTAPNSRSPSPSR